MIDNIIEAVITLIDYPVALSPMPAANGLGLCLTSGTSKNTFIDRNKIQSITVTLNGKNSDQRYIIKQLSQTHHKLTQLKVYPSAADWQILSISSESLPSYIDKEDGQYLYGSALNIQFYERN